MNSKLNIAVHICDWPYLHTTFFFCFKVDFFRLQSRIGLLNYRQYFRWLFSNQGVTLGPDSKIWAWKFILTIIKIFLTRGSLTTFFACRLSLLKKISIFKQRNKQCLLYEFHTTVNKEGSGIWLKPPGKTPKFVEFAIFYHKTKTFHKHNLKLITKPHLPYFKPRLMSVNLNYFLDNQFIQVN